MFDRLSNMAILSTNKRPRFAPWKQSPIKTTGEWVGAMKIHLPGLKPGETYRMLFGERSLAKLYPRIEIQEARSRALSNTARLLRSFFKKREFTDYYRVSLRQGELYVDCVASPKQTKDGRWLHPIHRNRYIRNPWV